MPEGEEPAWWTALARLAVLIDAENAPLWTVEPLLAEIARYGKMPVKRALR
ncbi:hypothetical protein [Parafrankia sp. FMc2]|uniref:hypothetical protein n=1 Tax=Parafrankia sp. FMc2 TaxID=3233196 RepID=UPI0034D4012B